MTETSPPHGFRRLLRRLALALLLLVMGTGFYHAQLKSLPAGLSVTSAPRRVPAGAVCFYGDITCERNGVRVCEQVIYDRALQLIREAQDFVLVDLFLFNDYLGRGALLHRTLCAEVVSALIAKKRERPAIAMVVISDPVNEAYGGPPSSGFGALRAAGIPVVLTDLARLRDSNPLWSAPWRLLVHPWGDSPRGWLPHPFSTKAGKVSLRSWLALLNFKANHRKLVVADHPAPSAGRELAALVMSANPHDGSSAHSNVAIEIRGDFAREVVRSEEAVLRLSGSSLTLSSALPVYPTPTLVDKTTEMLEVQLLTEGKIRTGLLEALATTAAGDRVDIGMFYLSERRIVDALAAAAQRGAEIRLILDPNRDAFGYAKDGVPNRPVAAELRARGSGRLQIRWYATHGEQFHSKLVLVHHGDQAQLFIGSANLTRRNIGDFNLETNVAVSGAPHAPALAAAQAWFERLWTNADASYTLPYETFRDDSGWKRWKYRVQEGIGLGTF